MFVTISLMYSRNSTGPSTDPCGTPDVTLQGEDCLPSTHELLVDYDLQERIGATVIIVL